MKMNFPEYKQKEHFYEEPKKNPMLKRIKKKNPKKTQKVSMKKNERKLL